MLVDVFVLKSPELKKVFFTKYLLVPNLWVPTDVEINAMLYVEINAKEKTTRLISTKFINYLFKYF